MLATTGERFCASTSSRSPQGCKGRQTRTTTGKVTAENAELADGLDASHEWPEE
jgi:hypothetical protein